MNPSFTIQLVTLSSGEKILRIENPATGLSLERVLDPAKPILPQKAPLVQLFEQLRRLDLVAA